MQSTWSASTKIYRTIASDRTSSKPDGKDELTRWTGAQFLDLERGAGQLADQDLQPEQSAYGIRNAQSQAECTSKSPADTTTNAAISRSDELLQNFGTHLEISKTAYVAAIT